MPLANRLGTRLMAGSPATMRKKAASGQDGKTSPAGTAPPCSTSPMPCSRPARPATIPNTKITQPVAPRSLDMYLL
jgi:hypothetical protein